MRRPATSLLLLLALLTAGCFGADDESAADPEDPRDPSDAEEPADGGSDGNATHEPNATRKLTLEGPEWRVGDAWTLDVAWGDERGTSTWELVTFLADGEHYWLGTPDRDQSLDHVVTDTNPLIGRIHYGILSPHESGRHAGMYEFPLTDGKSWKGFFFGDEWTFTAAEADVQGGKGVERGFLITGRIPGKPAAGLTVDYVPSEKWFRNLRIQGASGGDVTLTVTERATRDSGTYYFHRGPDVHEGPEAAAVTGVLEEKFTVEATDNLKLLLASVRAQGNGTVSLQFLDPDGNVAHEERAVAGADVDARVRIEDPTPGEWTIRYAGVPEATFHVKVWAVDEHKGTL